ncbi:tripartite tricarboxylate transporter TctB family protein, partial [Klebsiella pneumoniae]|uniref:tripartite tricarboxylate transporter TctB family protein n=1 Tax=Klebsiella pneumoniae TaxID=573 RepID=UPI00273155ED
PLATLLTRFGWTVLAFALFIGSVMLLGFLLSSILLLMAMLLLTGYWRHKAVAAAVAVALPLVLYLFFSSALNTRFPVGSLFRAIG